MSELLDAFKFSQEKKEIDTTKKLRIGIIGAGWIAEAHAIEYKQMPDVEIVAVADLINGKAQAFIEQNELGDAVAYPSHTALLEQAQVDAVSICTYNSTHAVCTIDALRAGVHVLLEKPMCVTLSEAVQICKAEKDCGKILSIGFQPRLDPNMKLVKKIVQSGVLGHIYYIQTGGGRTRGIPTPFGTTFIEKETGGIGALGDIGCYSLDMVLNAMGYPKPLTISGYTSDFFGRSKEYWRAEDKPESYTELFGVDDFAAAFVRLEGDTVLDFRIAWAMNLDTTGDTIFYGTKASLRVPSTECWNGSVGGNLKLYQDVSGQSVVTEIPMQKPLEKGCFYHKVRSFLDAIKENAPAPVPTSEILINQAIIDGINQSAKLGHEITVDIPEI